MDFVRHIMGLVAALLLIALSAAAMPIELSASHQAEFSPQRQAATVEHSSVHFAARAPPIAVTSVAFTGLTPVSQSVDDAGRFIVQTADGATGYLDVGGRFVQTGAPDTGVGGFYDPRAWRQNYEDFYNGNITSTTVPPYSAKNVQLAGQRHPETGVVFDQRGFPVFDNYAAYDTRFTGADFSSASYQTQMRVATRDLRAILETNPQLKSQFRPDQLQAIQSGNAKIPDYTWHHHQDTGRMQLVDETVHRRTGHIGGEAISEGH